MTSEQETWTPPVPGTPCWIEIPATDVSRAKKFYAQAFNWQFRPLRDGANDTDETLAMFNFPDPKFEKVGGGIKKADSEGKKGGGPILYLYVQDLEEAAKSIQSAGGKSVGSIIPEGEFGFYQLFEDTEGNVGGVYTMAKK